MRILVTGAAGFIGSNIVKRLAAEGHDTVALDNFSSAHWKNLVGYSGDVLETDLAGDCASLDRTGGFELIFHQASITDTTVMDQRLMMRNNVEGFRHLLERAVHWGSRVVWASSASIYGNGPAPMKEAQVGDPLNVYAFSKFTMENLARRYEAKLPQPIVGLRYFNVYGPGEDHKGKFASMIHQLAKQMRQGKRPRIFTAGQQKRDFVYIEDVLQANFRAANARYGGVYNVGCGQARSFNDVVEQLNRVLQTRLPPDYFENPYSFTQDCTQADLTESRRLLGYEPQFDLAKGMDAYAASGRLGMSI